MSAQKLADKACVTSGPHHWYRAQKQHWISLAGQLWQFGLI